MSSEPHDENPAAPVPPHQSNATDTCPPEAVWRGVAAGGLPEDEAMNYLRHASECEVCSVLLREASAMGDDAISPEEAAFLDQLETSSPEGHERLAKLLEERTAPRRRRLFSWPSRAVILSLAAVLLIALSFLGYRVLRPASDATLLARAYDKHRLSEMRIPGTRAVALASPTRGRGTTDTSSTELLQIKLRSQQQFEKTPNDAALRQTLGRIAIVEHDGETARRQFEMAEALNPQLPGLKFDFATAYFVLAESNGKPLDYARAIDFFGQYLQSVQQKDAVALFDQGLCWERQNVDSEAIQDFEAALALEKDAGWRKEIARHLQMLKDRDAPSSGPAPKAADLTPAVFLAHPEDGPGQYETWLDVASREWLPHRGESPEIDAALRLVGRMGELHADSWMDDMLRRPITPTETETNRLLSLALQATGRGETDQSLDQSSLAMAAYTKSGNQAGFLRAGAEHIHSLQRMGQGHDCLSEASRSLDGNSLTRYTWLTQDIDLEKSSCHAMLGEIQETLHDADEAATISRQERFPLGGVRAASVALIGSVRRGSNAQAWAIGTTHLELGRRIRSGSLLEYQLCNGLDRASQGLGLKWTRAGLAHAAVKAASGTGNKRVMAYSFEFLAQAELAVGEIPAARENFGIADRLLSTLGNGAAASRYIADWTTDRITLNAKEAGVASALHNLAREEAIYRVPDAFSPKLHFYTEYANLLRESQRYTESIEKVHEAIHGGEQLLSLIHDETERRAWLKDASRAYHVLILDFAESGDANASLESWEWLQSAPYRTDKNKLGDHLFADLGSRPVKASTQPRPRLTIVYAHVQDSYLAWSINESSSQPIRLRKIVQNPETIEGQARAFRRLCADPNSSKEDIALLGSNLYSILIAPFQDEVDRSDVLQFELDDAMKGLPFAALSHQGKFLGLEHPILFLAHSWDISGRLSSPDERLIDSPRILIVKESSSLSSAKIPEEYDESRDIVKAFSTALTRSASLHRTDSTLAVLGGDDLGRTLSHADVIHYIGHGLDEKANDQSGHFVADEPHVTLSHGALQHCALAVLAACRTSGDDGGVLAENSSFESIVLSSGAKNAIASQWDVDSAMTREMMARFYLELADHQTFPEALRRAQEALQANQRSSHPYFWSPFQLIGR